MKVFVADLLTYIKNTQVISDPFPEHTLYNSLPFRLISNPPEYVSIWAAYRRGYEKAYMEIEDAIGQRELK